MRAAILSDIHGNLEALEAVLAQVDQEAPDAIVCLGDFVGYGGAPNECVERLRPRLAVAVLGNHDAAALGRIQLGSFNGDAAIAARWTANALSPSARAWLDALPMAVTWHGARLVHASPLDPGAWNYVLSVQDAEEELGGFPEPVCFIGHSHYPGVFEAEPGVPTRYTRDAAVPLHPGRRYVVNVPSVGQPRDGDPRAGYVMWDRESGHVAHVRLAYDVAAAMRRIQDAGLPAFLAERLQWGE